MDVTAALISDTAAADRVLSSAVYTGRIRHRRYTPSPHQFSYPMFMMYLDLSELDRVFAGHWLWSLNRRNVAEFRRSDFLGDAQTPLDIAVRDLVQGQTGQRPSGPIRMLAHLRYFGFCFNPVAFYYCYAQDGTTLETIVAEITNTPWKERHAYVLPVTTAERHRSAYGWRFDKTFHVSPFLPMDRQYHWRFQPPGDELRLHMTVDQGEKVQFDATLVLARQPVTAGSLARALLRFPLMTAQVVLAIHWQAFFIWCKRNKVYDHPHKGKPS